MLTGERLERFYLFSRLKHLLEYISVMNEQLKSQPHSGHECHNTGKFYHS